MDGDHHGSHFTKPSQWFAVRNSAGVPRKNVGNYPCQIVTELLHDQGWVPHGFPGENPGLDLFPKVHGIIPEAARGGPETMMPEMRKKVVAAQPWPPPAQEVQQGGGGRGGGGAVQPGTPGPGARGGGAQRGPAVPPAAPGGRGQ